MLYSNYIVSNLPEGSKRHMNKTFIYVLKHPETGEVRYVGKAKDPRDRYHSHIHASKSSSKLPVVRWIAKLKQDGLLPIMEMIELTPDENFAKREQAWVAHYRSKVSSLLNITEGGEGLSGFNHSEKTKEKIAQAFRGHARPRDTREKIRKEIPNWGCSNVKGISYNKKQQRWYAQKQIAGIRCHLGSYLTEAEAVEALAQVNQLSDEEVIRQYRPGTRTSEDIWTPEKRAKLAQIKREKAILKPKGTSKYLGVHVQKKTGNWLCYIRVDGKALYQGTYTSEAGAASAYNRAARQYFGDKAVLNNVLGGELDEPKLVGSKKYRSEV